MRKIAHGGGGGGGRAKKLKIENIKQQRAHKFLLGKGILQNTERLR